MAESICFGIYGVKIDQNVYITLQHLYNIEMEKKNFVDHHYLNSYSISVLEKNTQNTHKIEAQVGNKQRYHD